MLIQDFLIESAKRLPGKHAVIHGKNRFTYEELLADSSRLASWLATADFSPGFRGAILTDDPYEYITSYFAILMGGGVVVGLNSQTTERTLEVIFNDCQPSLLFANRKYRKYFDQLAPASSVQAVVLGGEPGEGERLPVGWWDRAAIGPSQSSPARRAGHNKPTDIAQIIYTSGTTGAPKGVMLRHANLVANTKSIVEYLQLSEQDRVMAVLPFFYSYGNSILLTHFFVGGSLVVNQNFLYPNVILEEMVAEEVSGFSGVPSTFAILLNRSAIKQYSLPKLRYITQAGAAMAPSLAQRLSEILPQSKIYIMYGQTEASARLAYLPPEDLFRKAGSVGRAIPGVTLRLLDKQGNPVGPGETGEIVASGDNIMAGYWNKPAESARVLRKEGLWTGDLARVDEEGYLYIVSRKSEIIKSGSHRIAPKEIEEIILEHGAVHEVAVVGVADEILGQAIKAWVVLKGEDACSERELLKHCRRNLAPFKVPHKIVLCRELPKTATGKIRKKELAAQ